MAEQIGARIKEARLAAGMSQKALAEAVDGVSAKAISEAERGLRELTEEQLASIAEATGADPKQFGVVKDEAPATPAEAATAPAAKDEAPATPAEAATTSAIKGEDILKLFSAAGPAVKEAALSVLKGETSQSKDFLTDVLPMAAGLLGGNNGGNPLFAIIGFLGSEEGKAFLGGLKSALDNVTEVFGGIGAGGDEGQEGMGVSNSFLAFTFFYAVAIYVLLISFIYWQSRADTELEN